MRRLGSLWKQAMPQLVGPRIGDTLGGDTAKPEQHERQLLVEVRFQAVRVQLERVERAPRERSRPRAEIEAVLRAGGGLPRGPSAARLAGEESSFDRESLEEVRDGGFEERGARGVGDEPDQGCAVKLVRRGMSRRVAPRAASRSAQAGRAASDQGLPAPGHWDEIVRRGAALEFLQTAEAGLHVPGSGKGMAHILDSHGANIFGRTRKRGRSQRRNIARAASWRWASRYSIRKQ